MSKFQRLRDILQKRLQDVSSMINRAPLEHAAEVAAQELSDTYFIVADELDEIELDTRQSKTPGQIIAGVLADKDLIVPLMVGLPLIIGMIIGGVLGASL